MDGLGRHSAGARADGGADATARPSPRGGRHSGFGAKRDAGAGSSGGSDDRDLCADPVDAIGAVHIQRLTR